MRKFEQQVRNGFVLLDLEAPGWRDKIDRGGLNMKNCFYCVCGQVFGGFYARFPGASSDDSEVFLLALRHGFAVAPADFEDEKGKTNWVRYDILYAELQAEWLLQLAAPVTGAVPEPEGELVGV